VCKTSNPGSGDLQDVLVEGGRWTMDGGPSTIPLYEYVAHLAKSWNTKNNIGLVVGATYPEALARVRAAAPDLWLLVPGIGSQSGDLESALKAGLRRDGKGALINVSRSIARAAAGPAKAAAELRDQIIHIQYNR
jgi:uridine monophosphate synthetase